VVLEHGKDSARRIRRIDRADVIQPDGAAVGFPAG
jgi:hypothetical protein